MTTAAVAILTLVAGIWCLAAPDSFARAVAFPPHEHFLHDVGAFQIGAGATLLLALVWADAPATALAGFLVANSIHAVNHALDLAHGGRLSDPWLLGVVSALTAAALALRLRQLGYVVGAVGTATTPALAPFVRQKTVLLTTYRADGTPGASPVSIAVDGQRAVFRSFEKALKTRRLRRRPLVEVAPSTGRGQVTGPAIRAEARRLEGAEAARAARLLAAKYPLLHGVLVPLAHRLLRHKTGRTVHFELTPLPLSAVSERTSDVEAQRA
jgi:PPOX class probable F420-dependent enzyme